MPTPFLLDERNRPFVQGLAPRPPAAQSRLGAGCMIAFFAPFVLAGMFLLAMTFSTWATWLSFSATARPATAVVTGKTIDDSGDDTSYLIDYRYSTPNERSFSGQASVSRERYDSVGVGEQIGVEYLGGDEAQSRIADANHLALPIFLTFFTLVWDGFVMVVLYLMISGMVKEGRLRSAGQLVMAEIISYRAEPDSDNDLSVSVEYRLFSPEGRAISGSYRGTRNDMKGRPEPACPSSAAALYLDERSHMLL